MLCPYTMALEDLSEAKREINKLHGLIRYRDKKILSLEEERLELAHKLMKKDVEINKLKVGRLK